MLRVLGALDDAVPELDVAAGADRDAAHRVKRDGGAGDHRGRQQVRGPRTHSTGDCPIAPRPGAGPCVDGWSFRGADARNRASVRSRFRLTPRARLLIGLTLVKSLKEALRSARSKHSLPPARFQTDAPRVTPSRLRAVNASAMARPHASGCGVAVANRWRHAAHATDGHSRAQAGDVGLGMGATREANHPNPPFIQTIRREPRVAGVPTGSPRRHRSPPVTRSATDEPPLEAGSKPR